MWWLEHNNSIKMDQSYSVFLVLYYDQSSEMVLKLINIKMY